jgi:hypothetical protein
VVPLAFKAVPGDAGYLVEIFASSDSVQNGFEYVLLGHRASKSMSHQRLEGKVASSLVTKQLCPVPGCKNRAQPERIVDSRFLV